MTSTSEEIRQAMRASSEPLYGREICDALGAETPEERNRITSTVSAMASNGSGIERLDDGRFSMIPGWKPKRNGPGSWRNPARKPEPEPGTYQRAAAETADVEYKPAREAFVGLPSPLASSLGMTTVGELSKDEVATAAVPGLIQGLPRTTTVALPRAQARALVVAILDAGIRLEGELLEAVVEVTRAAA